jgi:hypothetical protein
MEDLQPVANKTFRYPAVYRSLAWFSVMLSVLVALGCVVAIISAVQRAEVLAAFYALGAVSAIVVLIWGLDFATRSITPGPDGLHVRWLLHRSVVPWPDVLGWRYRALSLIHIRVQRGRGIFVWPLLENYTDLLNEIDAQRRAALRHEMLTR